MWLMALFVNIFSTKKEIFLNNRKNKCPFLKTEQKKSGTAQSFYSGRLMMGRTEERKNSRNLKVSAHATIWWKKKNKSPKIISSIIQMFPFVSFYVSLLNANGNCRRKNYAKFDNNISTPLAGISFWNAKQ